MSLIGHFFLSISPLSSTYRFFLNSFPLSPQLNSLNKENLRQRHIIDREAAARKVIMIVSMSSLNQKSAMCIISLHRIFSFE